MGDVVDHVETSGLMVISRDRLRGYREVLYEVAYGGA